MDSFELNKIAGAVLATALGVMVLSIVSESIFHAPEPAQPGFEVAVAEDSAGGGSAAEPAGEDSIAVRLASANLAAGEQALAKCRSCHTFDKGDERKTPGPNLYGVVGELAAHLDSFANYSAAMKDKHAEGYAWTFEHLDAFLANPRAEVPGTAMTFAGLRNPVERANLIAYLNSNSDNPQPLPAADEATDEAPADEAAAEDAAPAPAETAEESPAPAEAAPADEEAPAVTEEEPAEATSEEAEEAPAAEEATEEAPEEAPATEEAPAVEEEAPASETP